MQTFLRQTLASLRKLPQFARFNCRKITTLVGLSRSQKTFPPILNNSLPPRIIILCKFTRLFRRLIASFVTRRGQPCKTRALLFLLSAHGKNISAKSLLERVLRFRHFLRKKVYVNSSFVLWFHLVARYLFRATMKRFHQ